MGKLERDKRRRFGRLTLARKKMKEVNESTISSQEPSLNSTLQHTHDY
jgi:hypothetical protein